MLTTDSESPSRRLGGQLRALARELRAGQSQGEKVGLFASYASGTYGPHGNADVLIVLRDRDKPFRDRILDFLPDGIGVPCGVLLYASCEIQNLQRDRSPWITHILEEVTWL